MAKRSASSRRWLAEHEGDEFVKRARESGYRSRAVFKLQDIQRTDRVIRPGMTIVDLGAAPGGWSQFAAQLMRGNGRIVALDILPMDDIPGVEFLQGDFSCEATATHLLDLLGEDRPQLVMSDIAPNTTGIADVDHDRSMYLVEQVVDFASQTLQPGGDLIVKVFQGRDFQQFVRQLRRSFKSVKVRKPPASRSRSVELYLLARDFKS